MPSAGRVPASPATTPLPSDKRPGSGARSSEIMARDPAGYEPFRLDLPLDQLEFELGDRLGRIEALRAGLGAVHDGVAAIEPERILEIVEPFAGRFIAAVLDPAVRLQQRGRAQIALAVPPIARTGGRAAGAEDAFVEAVELLAVLVALLPFLLRRRRRRLQPRFDRGILRVEIGQVRHQVLD